MVYDIWMEGFQVMEGSDTASFYARGVEASSFKAACKKAAKEKEDSCYDAKRNTVWGCRLFPTESEARRSFG